MTPLLTPDGLLILDLDETLVHTKEHSLGRKADFRLGELHIYKRPYVDQFVTDMSGLFQLAVWSAGSADYVDFTVAQLLPKALTPVFVWSRRRCTYRFNHETGEECNLKALKKVKRKGYKLSRVLIVEDTPANVARNYGNAIYVKPFEGDQADDELLHLCRYLRSIADCPDFLRLEKRNWREVSANGN
ncbi:MAG TPA: HAD family hydrolase [Candidatus Obscuribacterales bacterium]